MNKFPPLFVGVTVFSGGCVTFPREQIPLFPESIPADPYAQHAQVQLSEHGSSQFRLAIDAAIPGQGEPGVYVYLLVTASPPSAHLRSVAGMFGRTLSHAEDPHEFVEALRPSGETVQLEPMRHPSEFHIGQPLLIHYREPWNEPVNECDADEAVVQLCMWRVNTALVPGTYRIRLRNSQPDDPEYGWLWKATGGVDADVKWKTLHVDVQSTSGR